MIVTLTFILFVALIFNMFIKFTCIIGIFINFLIHIFIIFLRIVFRIYYFLTVGVFFFWPLYCFCMFLLIFYTFFTNSNDYNLSSGSDFFRVHTDIDKDADFLQSNNNDSLNYLWLLFATLFFFLKVWFNNRSNIKLRLLVILIVSVLLFLQKHIKNPDQTEAIRSCSKHEFFTFDLMLVRIFSYWKPN